MADPILALEGLSKSYGALKVTDDLSLQVRRGELHAVIGPNGAGKTTLVDLISGFLPPDGGRIAFEGADVTALPPYSRARRGLARSFQITSILARFSVLENVALAVQARAGSSFRFLRSAARDETLNGPARDLLRRVGLADETATRAGALSHGGQRQLEIAIALACAPRLLVLDEPLAGTSHAESARIVSLLADLKGSVTILLIEHDMEAVFSLADRITVLALGRAIATGTPADIRNNREVRLAYLGDEVPC